MTSPVSEPVAPRASTLHWWAVAAAIAAIAVPLPDGWGFTARVAALLFGIVALCLVRGRAPRAIATVVVVVVGAVVGLEAGGQVAAILLEQSFIDDAVVIG